MTEQQNGVQRRRPSHRGLSNPRALVAPKALILSLKYGHPGPVGDDSDDHVAGEFSEKLSRNPLQRPDRGPDFPGLPARQLSRNGRAGQCRDS